MNLSLYMLKPGSALLVFVAVLLSTGDASAYNMWLTADANVDTMVVGDSVAVSLHLDTEGASNIQLLEVSVLFDTSTLRYDRASSSYGSNILFSPGAAGKGDPGTWLTPVLEAPYLFPGNPNQFQINTAMYVNSLLSPETSSTGELLWTSTSATSNDVILSTMVFEMENAGMPGIELSMAFLSNILQVVSDDGLTLSTVDPGVGQPLGFIPASWPNHLPLPPDTGGGTAVQAVPEPSAAVLFAAGVALLAARFGRVAGQY